MAENREGAWCPEEPSNIQAGTNGQTSTYEHATGRCFLLPLQRPGLSLALHSRAGAHLPSPPQASARTKAAVDGPLAAPTDIPWGNFVPLCLWLCPCTLSVALSRVCGYCIAGAPCCWKGQAWVQMLRITANFARRADSIVISWGNVFLIQRCLLQYLGWKCLHGCRILYNSLTTSTEQNIWQKGNNDRV